MCHAGKSEYKLLELLQVSSRWGTQIQTAGTSAGVIVLENHRESGKFYYMINPFLYCREGTKEISRKLYNNLHHNLYLLPNTYIFRLM
jgi:hypothetical protein